MLEKGKWAERARGEEWTEWEFLSYDWAFLDKKERRILFLSRKEDQKTGRQGYHFHTLWSFFRGKESYFLLTLTNHTRSTL